MTVQVSQGGVNPAALGGLPVLVREAAKALVTIHNFGQDWLGFWSRLVRNGSQWLQCGSTTVMYGCLH